MRSRRFRCPLLHWTVILRFALRHSEGIGEGDAVRQQQTVRRMQQLVTHGRKTGKRLVCRRQGLEICHSPMQPEVLSDSGTAGCCGTDQTVTQLVKRCHIHKSSSFSRAE